MRSGLTARPESLEVLLDREQDAFDRILAEVRAGVRCTDRYDDLEELADEHCRRVRAAFRSCRKAT